MNLAGKKVTVVGSGVSGIGAVKLLCRIGADIVLYDGNENLTKEAVMAKLPEGIKIDIVIGRLTDELIKKLTLWL